MLWFHKASPLVVTYPQELCIVKWDEHQKESEKTEAQRQKDALRRQQIEDAQYNDTEEYVPEDILGQNLARFDLTLATRNAAKLQRQAELENEAATNFVKDLKRQYLLAQATTAPKHSDPSDAKKEEKISAADLQQKFEKPDDIIKHIAVGEVIKMLMRSVGANDLAKVYCSLIHTYVCVFFADLVDARLLCWSWCSSVCFLP